MLAVVSMAVSACSGPAAVPAVTASTGALRSASTPPVTSGPSAGSAVAAPSGTPVTPAASTPATPAESSPAGTAAAVTPVPSGAAGCPGVRCLSIVVTGDVLLHPPLVDQARADAPGPGGQGMDFAPMLAAEKPYIQGADLGICHLGTPLAPAGGAGHCPGRVEGGQSRPSGRRCWWCDKLTDIAIDQGYVPLSLTPDIMGETFVLSIPQIDAAAPELGIDTGGG